MAGARQAIFEQRKKTSQASRNDACAGGADDRPVPLDAGNAGSEDATDAKQASGQVSILAVEVERHRRGDSAAHLPVGRTWWWERVSQFVSYSVVEGAFKKKKH